MCLPHLSFHTGTQPVTLENSEGNVRRSLTPVTTTFVKIVVLTVYSTRNNGAREISFEGPTGSGKRSLKGEAECKTAASRNNKAFGIMDTKDRPSGCPTQRPAAAPCAPVLPLS